MKRNVMTVLAAFVVAIPGLSRADDRPNVGHEPPAVDVRLPRRPANWSG